MVRRPFVKVQVVDDRMQRNVNGTQVLCTLFFPLNGNVLIANIANLQNQLTEPQWKLGAEQTTASNSTLL